MRLTFEDYCDDIIGLSLGLAGNEEIAQARKTYKEWMKPVEKEDNHSDSNMKLGDLRNKAKNLTISQEYAINKYKDSFDVNFVEKHVRYAKELLSGKNTKAQLLDLITANSEISRDLNKIIKN